MPFKCTTPLFSVNLQSVAAITTIHCRTSHHSKEVDPLVPLQSIPAPTPGPRPPLVRFLNL